MKKTGSSPNARPGLRRASQRGCTDRTWLLQKASRGLITHLHFKTVLRCSKLDSVPHRRSAYRFLISLLRALNHACTPPHPMAGRRSSYAMSGRACEPSILPFQSVYAWQPSSSATEIIIEAGSFLSTGREHFYCIHCILLIQ